MIKKEIDIDVFGFKLIYIETSKVEDMDEVREIIEPLKLGDENMEYTNTIVTLMVNSGMAIYDNEEKVCVIVIANPKSKIMREELVAHEKRHVEDNILEYCGINDRETAAYLAGYLSKKLYNGKT